MIINDLITDLNDIEIDQLGATKIKDLNKLVKNLKNGVKVFKKYSDNFIITESTSKKFGFFVQKYEFEKIKKKDRERLSKYNWRLREECNNFSWYLFYEDNL